MSRIRATHNKQNKLYTHASCSSTKHSYTMHNNKVSLLGMLPCLPGTCSTWQNVATHGERKREVRVYKVHH